MEAQERSVPAYKRYTDYSVDMYTRDGQQTHRLLRGRALLSPEKGEMAFVENEPRGPRSREIMRTNHARTVRRPDGRYTISFAMLDGDEKNLREQLLAEIRKIVSFIGEDRKAEKAKQAKEEKKGGEKC